MKRIVLIVLLVEACIPLFAQGTDDCRMRALSFFCANKDRVFKLNNPPYRYSYPFIKDVAPMFFLDIRATGDELTPDFYIDSASFIIDTVLLKILWNDVFADCMTIADYVSIDTISTTDTKTFLSTLCSCIFLDPWLFDVPCAIDTNDCKREYKLDISNILSYNGSKYVVLRVTSFFLGKVDGTQFCIMEFSHEGNVRRCGMGGVWIP